MTFLGEGNGNPLQCSCLENPRDGGAWWAAAYGVAQSRTRLKRLSSSSSSRVTFLVGGVTCNPSRTTGRVPAPTMDFPVAEVIHALLGQHEQVVGPDGRISSV